jgi:hypothetical protein
MRGLRRFALALALATIAAAALSATALAAPPGATKAGDLFAGQTTDVGDLFVWNDTTNLYVQFSLSSGWCMSESHLAVATDVAAVPKTKTGNPIPGQFAYKATHTPCVSTYTYTVPLVAGWDVGANLVLAAHAKVQGTERVTNGGFEDDEVAGVNGWAIFATPAGWLQQAFSGVPDPGDPQGLELQEENLFAGGDAQAAAGDQWAELDAYYPLKIIAQSVPACETGKYVLRYAWSPRPGVAQNALQVAFEGQTWSHAADGTANTTTLWTYETKFLTGPKTGDVVLSFAETGPNDQLGMFLDAVSLTCQEESAWAGTPVGQTQFAGANWATYVRYTLQPVLLQTLTVPAGNPAGADSVVLAAGESFLFRVTGTTTWTNRDGYDVVDAECVSTNGSAWLDNVYASNPPLTGVLDEDLLELQIGSTSVEWTSVGLASAEGCDAAHEYTRTATGAGAAVNFRIYDGTGNVQVPGWFADNTGSLTVQIWQTSF